MDQWNGTWTEERRPDDMAPQAGAASTSNMAPQPMPAPAPYVVAQPPRKEDTNQTKHMKENFAFFGPVTFLYAAFYAFCMFKNSSGVTFPFFVAASLLFLCFSLSKLEITFKRGNIFYMTGMMLLAVSTFCTDDGRIIAFNKTGIFLLMMSLLLRQFYNTSGWKLGKYLGSIFMLVFASLGELPRPFTDAARFFKRKESRHNRTLWYAILGMVIATPLITVVMTLLAAADAVFRHMTSSLLESISIGNIFNILFRIGFIFFASYLLTAYLCRHTLSEQVKDKRKGEPVLAITVTGLLSVIYLLFSGIQIVYLFLGQMQLPEGYTYAEYAREGFFQLLLVSILNLIIVLVCMNYFRENKILKTVLTVMSLCTFVMIASSALRMIIYIRFYYLTFLRILVLWALALLFLLFIGVIASIYSDRFPLFGYGTVVVTVLYVGLSFAHPDYIIAAVNVANAPGAGVEEWKPTSSFFLSETPYHDYGYLSGLSADAAPVLIPYMAELGYHLEWFYEDGAAESAELTDVRRNDTNRIAEGGSLEYMIRAQSMRRHRVDEFGYFYLRKLQNSTENFGIRTYNISRDMALRQIAAYNPQGD